jgi:DNA-binding transcriptional LysR family regulator
VRLLKDRYVVLLRKGHPFVRRRRTGRALLQALPELEFVAVRAHAETLRILNALQLQERLRLTTEHFLVLPSIVRATDLAAVMPRNIALGFEGGWAIVEPDFPQREFTVSLHWSKRFEADPGNRWLRGVILGIQKSGQWGPVV